MLSPFSSAGGKSGLSRRAFLKRAGTGLASTALLPQPVVISASTTMGEVPSEHPFLLYRKEQFPELRKRARREPWSSMKQTAIRTANQGLTAIDDDLPARRLQKYFGACTLAYIVDPDRRPIHAERVSEKIVQDLKNIAFDESKNWMGVVPPMGAAFVGIIALDTVYNHLPAAQRQECEHVIATQLSKIQEEGAWPNGRRGTHETWKIYRGERAEPDDAFYERYLEQMTDDGVSTAASSYAWSRLGSSASRPQKTGYADVLEFTDIDSRYYGHPRLQKFYRWLFGSAITPARHLHPFGDFYMFNQYPLEGTQEEQLEESALAYRTGRFDTTAGRYAAWFLAERDPPGHILAYVPKKKTYEPKVPTSTLYMDGGAFFREPEDSVDSLSGMLYNVTERVGWHAHQETNALALSGYGGHLLVNGGWLGPVTRPARRNNTLTINGHEHDKRTGAGLREGLTSTGLDYAAGHSGEALPGNAWFERSLILVHGQGPANGYFVTVDEVQAEPGDSVNHCLHPATGTVPRKVEDFEYEVMIDRFNEVKGNRLAIVYGQTPDEVTRTMIPTGSDRADAPKHYRQEALFRANHEGERRLLTVLFPHNQHHRKANFARHSTEGSTGISIRHTSNTRDYVYQTTKHTSVEIDGSAQAQGRAVLFRACAGATPFYFVRQGTQFRRGDVGFSAKGPVTIHMRSQDGRITTEESVEITFFHPKVRAIRHGSTTLAPLEQENGAMRVRIPAGSNQPIHLVGPQ